MSISKIKTEVFISKAKLKHGEKYDYSKTNYNGSKNAITIICAIHGKFSQRASCHLEGNGCKKCATEKVRQSCFLKKEEFIRKSIEKHGLIYDYSKSIYFGYCKKLIIICKKHGEFLQTPAMHLKTHGCPECGYESMGKFGWNGIGDLSYSYYSQIMRGAKVRNIEFDVDIKYLWDLFEKQKGVCALSGEEIRFFNRTSRSRKTKKHIEENTASVDRIDSKKGYVKGNLQWVHKTINIMKQAYSQQEFLKWCKLVTNKKS